MWKRDWPIPKEAYIEEFLRYYDLASLQQAESNLGLTPHTEGLVRDELMQQVTLYDVVERKYAGFTQLLLDLWYGYEPEHPYWAHMHVPQLGPAARVRLPIAQRFGPSHTRAWSLSEWLYVFLIHRMTGSGINYAKRPSGYNNTILPLLDPTLELPQLADQVRGILSGPVPAYTSVGYQFPAFPKKTEGFKRGGDKYLVEFAPVLAVELADFLATGGGLKKGLRQVGDFMADWNRRNGLRVYHFQHAAFISDIADFFPQYVNTCSHFYYGKNAIECSSYLTGGNTSLEAMDALMDGLSTATGAKPYNLEDVMCDFIRWVEHYVKPGGDYDHVCRDTVWGSTSLVEHPYGRQRPMLEMGLVSSFNHLKHHPSDDFVIKQAGLDPLTYVEAVWYARGRRVIL